MTPEVSIIVLNHNYPHNIRRLLGSITQTAGPAYELVVVDNGSEPESVEMLKGFETEGKIDTLVLEPTNHFFSEGNNIGVRNSNPESKYILLLNNDTEVLQPSWLLKMVDWMEGVPRLRAFSYCPMPVSPSTKPRDIVSYDWVYDRTVPGEVRPDGWCCLIRRSVWQELSSDLPWFFGFEEMIGNVIRAGARCGVLCKFFTYIKHYGQGSEVGSVQYTRDPMPKMAELFRDVRCESLDFRLGPDQHLSYLDW